MATALPSVQKVVRLMQRPMGMVKPGVDLVVQEAAVHSGPLASGELLVKNIWMSLDPAMRGWMKDAKSYIEPVGLGDVMRAGCIGEVVKSSNDKFREGDLVSGMFGWQQFCHVDDPKKAGVYSLPQIPGVSPSVFLGTLGMTGLTAYFGLLDVGKPKAGDTVVVTAAAGATGSVVGQIAKHVVGCNVVGVAGGPDKCAWLVDELGFDAAVDYKSEPDFTKALRAATPKGIDVAFDNVGGGQLDSILARINRGARVVICGAISQYSAASVQGPSNYLTLLTQRARMEGFIVFDYAKQYPKALQDLGGWLLEGKLQFKEDVVKGGLDVAPEALLRLFNGSNKGKLLVQVVDDDELPRPKSKL